jgi:hypothetical protein
MHEEAKEARRFATEALDLIDKPGTSLEVSIALAAQAARLRGHAAEFVWLEMQLADIPMEWQAEIPENLLRIWEGVRADFALDNAAERQARKNANAMFSESRALPYDPQTVFGKSIEEMERSVALYDEIPEDARFPELTAGIENVRGVHSQIKERLRRYLSTLVA